MDIRTTVTLNNGVTMPCLGFGVFRASVEETEPAVRWALEEGYRHIDTASFYKNEDAVGRAVKSSGLKREDIFITTKLWNDDMRANRQKEAFEKSMGELGLEYLDLYLIHWPVENFAASWKVLEEIHASGRIKAIGVSNFQTHHLDTLLQTAKIVPAVNQIESHPYLTQKPLLAYCHDKGIVCQAWSPLGGQGAKVLGEQILHDIAAKHGKTPAQVVLRWDLQRDIVPLPKSVHQDRIRSNTKLYDFSLSDAEMAAIHSLNRNQRFGSDPDTFTF